MQKSNNVKKMVQISVISGISYLLMFLAVPIIPVVPYLKIDFSDIPILIGITLFGFRGSVIATLLKGLLYFITTGLSIPSFIGVLSSITATIILLIFYYLMRNMLNQNIYTKGLKVSIISIILTIIMSVENLFIITPLYLKVLNMDLGMSVIKLIIYGVIPFNLIKGILVGGLFMVISNKLNIGLNKIE
ncbi:ECF transporter S component [Lactobacillus sp. S2-2]|uniref:ECF transporter S component n=1 Tax=Lactobacillus sp. S2-2 TaxID=2692917 RepID=UPI001F0130D1|nr:ECF transporter S component [Lactobacillus sp. S2-2]MCF6515015.1 ECF transporter S component [Lactobacillus sp. S2-2]